MLNAVFLLTMAVYSLLTISLSYRLMLMLVVLMTLHLLIPTSNYVLSHVAMIKRLRYLLYLKGVLV